SCPLRNNSETIDFIGRKGHTLDSVPEIGEVVYLNNKGNISYGGDPVDVLDELSDEVKATAVKALQAVPGLHHAAVDLIIEENQTDNNAAYVIKLNPSEQLGSILFRMYGKPRDIRKAIIDYYFPETKDVEIEREKLYFDFYDVLDPLISRQATITTVSPAMLG